MRYRDHPLIEQITSENPAANSNLYKEIEMSTPCADLVELIRYHRERIRRYRFLIFTDAEMSSTLKTLDTLDISGVPAECQIWNIDRIFRVCSSDTGRQDIEIDFREYTTEGIPCLEASNAATAEYNSYLCIVPGSVYWIGRNAFRGCRNLKSIVLPEYLTWIDGLLQALFRIAPTCP